MDAIGSVAPQLIPSTAPAAVAMGAAIVRSVTVTARDQLHRDDLLTASTPGRASQRGEIKAGLRQVLEVGHETLGLIDREIGAARVLVEHGVFAALGAAAALGTSRRSLESAVRSGERLLDI